jgi:hypothetical protein
MMRDEAYRKRVLTDLTAAGGSADDFGQASDWTFVFAIATSREGSLKSLYPSSEKWLYTTTPKPFASEASTLH